MTWKDFLEDMDFFIDNIDEIIVYPVASEYVGQLRKIGVAMGDDNADMIIVKSADPYPIQHRIRRYNTVSRVGQDEKSIVLWANPNEDIVSVLRYIQAQKKQRMKLQKLADMERSIARLAGRASRMRRGVGSAGVNDTKNLISEMMRKQFKERQH